MSHNNTQTAMTIRAMMGAPQTVPDLATAALIVIDAQMEYGPHGALPLVGLTPALARIAALLSAVRRVGGRVVHVAHQGGAGGPFDPAGPGFAFLPEATPIPGEAIVRKTRADSFSGTDLDDVLRAWGGKTVILVGFMTHNCVAATTVGAIEHGYQPIVIGDATATRDLPDPFGGPVQTAAMLQAACLAGLSDTMAQILPTASLI